ncbi:MAG TPA: bifunctional YncE family protein/alkaline phosphatase family protein [Bryobacteraceae bacterium]|nr:bifunctional YncE family protein/alkaline phosphatase family protein [Bryobacteraceae bacterium]
MRSILLIAACAAAGILLVSQPAPVEQPGPLPGGGTLLVNGWRIQPAGKQIPLDTLPMASVLSPDRRHLIVLNGGYKPPSLSVVDLASGQEVSRKGVADGWLGLTFSPDGRFLYVGGGSEASVFEFTFAEGRLEPARTFEIVPQEKRTPQDFIGDVTISPDGRLIFAAGLYHDAVHVINPQSGRVIERWATGRRPYRILFHPDGKSYFVSSWADGSVSQFNAISGERLATVRIGAHPTDMLWRNNQPGDEERNREAEETGAAPSFVARIFVAAANTNNVYSIGVSAAKDLRVLESINVAMTPRQPAGMTPSALAMDAKQQRLFVVCSDANAVAVADVSSRRTDVLGFVPTGWYPTAARSLPDGRLVVLNGRGQRSLPNRYGPVPTRRPAPLHEGAPAVEYVGRIQTGTASLIEAFDDEQLEKYSQIVIRNSPYRDELLDRVPIPEGNPIPSRPGDASPIRHVIYIVKENRTYDQVLGDLGRGNGDPSLTLFGEQITPNHHKLAREFVLLDNFYVNADVSADGHNWSTAAIANDYVQKLWPNSYARRRRLYDYEGSDPATLPPAGYIWTNAHQAGLWMRNFGWWVTNGPRVATGERQIRAVRDPVLTKYTNPNYRAFDMDYPDVERVKIFLQDLAEWEKAGDMPRWVFARLGNDHTFGLQPGKLSPVALVADNDYALGLLVEGVSKSRFWAQTAIFVLEDDAQNGPDHVDSHRSPAFVLSPYTRRGGLVDSTMYNTVSMLRTMELILGLRPLTHFDAGAKTMHGVFSKKPDARAYIAEKPRVSLEERNPDENAMARRSTQLDFSEADRIDDEQLNEILWRAIRGSEPPAPTRSRFSR